MTHKPTKIAMPISRARALAWWACYGINMAYGGSYEERIIEILYDLQAQGLLPKNEEPEFGTLRRKLDARRPAHDGLGG